MLHRSSRASASNLSRPPELPAREEKEQETEKEEAKTFEVPAEEPAQPAQAEPEDGETSILMNLMSVPTSSKICMNDAEVLAWQLYIILGIIAYNYPVFDKGQRDCRICRFVFSRCAGFYKAAYIPADRGTESERGKKAKKEEKISKRKSPRKKRKRRTNPPNPRKTSSKEFYENQGFSATVELIPDRGGLSSRRLLRAAYAEPLS